MATVAEAVQHLRAAGITVHEYPGWQSRSAGGTFEPRGIMFHHDASAEGPSPSVKDYMWVTGQPRVPPPLCHFWVDTAGEWWVGANGRANHAGLGQWKWIPQDQGNRYLFGVETDHTVNEPWSTKQYNGIRDGFAAICRGFRWDVSVAVLGHKEYAPTRKIDPTVDMSQFRRDVAAVNTPAPTPPEDWFDMASKEDLKAAVREVLREEFREETHPVAGTAGENAAQRTAAVVRGEDLAAIRNSLASQSERLEAIERKL